MRRKDDKIGLMNRSGVLASFLTCMWFHLAGGASAQTICEVVIRNEEPIGTIRPLHGVNDGPLHAGDTLDLSNSYRELGIPLTRLHDCHWPTADVVDIHVVFPNFAADPSEPENYDFRRTDDYIQAIVDVGSEIVFRLGESIEHSKRKYHVHPPADPDKWAAICLGIVRHYNDGWANGFHHKIRYWEIWNEPENRPAMWTGDDEDYYRMYAAAAKTIKTRFPDIRIGGPAVGFAGVMKDKRLEPTQFVRGFLDRCHREKLPLDFFSWHTYTNDPWELRERALAVRQLLNEAGFNSAENHLNEWNYLPDNDWSPMMGQEPRVRQAWFARLHGPEGAAFTAASLILFQDASLDAANFYSAANHGFGMFSEHGVPYKNYNAMKAFQQLLTTPLRLKVDGDLSAGVALIAGTNKERTAYNFLVSNTTLRPQQLTVRMSQSREKRFTCRILRVDAKRALVADEETPQLPLTLLLPASSVALIRVD